MPSQKKKWRKKFDKADKGKTPEDDSKGKQKIAYYVHCTVTVTMKEILTTLVRLGQTSFSWSGL